MDAKYNKVETNEGCCKIYIIDLESRRAAIVEEFYIWEKYRGQGFGKILMDKAIRFSKLHNCDCIEGCYDPKNIPADRLYRRTGLEPDGEIRTRLSLKKS